MTMGDSRSVVTKNQFQESGYEFNGKLIIKDENFSFTLNSAKDSGTWSRFEDGDSDCLLYTSIVRCVTGSMKWRRENALQQLY